MSHVPHAGPGLWVQITHRFGPRMPEWFMAGHMTAFGIVLLIADGLFLQPTWKGFRSVFAFTGMGGEGIQFWMGVFMVLAGLLRFGGLIVNGARKHVTPRIRQYSAAAGCFIWFGIAYGFASSDVISTWLAIYPIFGVNELVNIYRAARDEGETKNGRTV
jgi:hypothetical protein